MDPLMFNEYKLKKYLVEDGCFHPFALILPGGGYFMVANHSEGKPYAKELNKRGIHAFVLRYRVKEKAAYPNPLLDVVRAMKEIIEHAEEYRVDLTNYAVYGSSAGGHLAGMYGRSDIGYKKFGLPKPSALVFIYPVVSLRDPTHIDTRNNILGNKVTPERIDELSLEFHIDSEFPKTFVWCGEADSLVDPIHSKKLDEALTKSHVEHIYKTYPGLDHGVGIAKGTIAANWMNESIDFWLNGQKK